jgi:hypothetical protein
MGEGLCISRVVNGIDYIIVFNSTMEKHGLIYKRCLNTSNSFVVLLTSLCENLLVPNMSRIYGNDRLVGILTL